MPKLVLARSSSHPRLPEGAGGILHLATVCLPAVRIAGLCSRQLAIHWSQMDRSSAQYPLFSGRNAGHWPQYPSSWYASGQGTLNASCILSYFSLVLNCSLTSHLSVSSTSPCRPTARHCALCFPPPRSPDLCTLSAFPSPHSPLSSRSGHISYTTGADDDRLSALSSLLICGLGRLVGNPECPGALSGPWRKVACSSGAS